LGGDGWNLGPGPRKRRIESQPPWRNNRLMRHSGGAIRIAIDDNWRNILKYAPILRRNNQFMRQYPSLRYD
jgi:hypothetical protein